MCNLIVYEGDGCLLVTLVLLRRTGLFNRTSSSFAAREYAELDGVIIVFIVGIDRLGRAGTRRDGSDCQRMRRDSEGESV